MRIMLVEDNELLAQGICLSLAKLGMQVDHLNSYQQALLGVKNESFSAIVLDLGLPDGNGKELLKAWRQHIHHIGSNKKAQGIGDKHRNGRVNTPGNSAPDFYTKHAASYKALSDKRGGSGGQYGHQRGDQDRTTRLGGLVLLGGLLGFVSGCGHGVKLLRVASPGYARGVPERPERAVTEFRRVFISVAGGPGPRG